MDRKQISLQLTFRALDLDFKVDSFTDRLILQKAIYLAQLTGVDLGYSHSWYVHGPYCSSLTSDAFAIQSELGSGPDDSDDWQLDENSLKRLTRIKNLVTEQDRLKLRKKLELYASVHFLIIKKSISKTDLNGIADTLKSFGKDFDESDVSGAVNGLIEYGLLN